MPKTEEGTETCFLPHQPSTNTFLESSSKKKPQNNPTMRVSISSNMSLQWELFPESRLIRDSEFWTAKAKIGLRAWTLFQPWPNNSMNWVAGLPSGELFFKSEKAFHLNKPFNRTHGDLQDMPLSAKKTALFQLLNQKFCQTAPIQLNTVKRSLKRYWQQSSVLCKRTTSFWKDAFWNLTWLLTAQLTRKRKRTTLKKKPSEQWELFQDQFLQLWSELPFCQEVKLKKKLHYIWTSWTKLKTLEDHGLWVSHSEELCKTVPLRHGVERTRTLRLDNRHSWQEQRPTPWLNWENTRDQQTSLPTSLYSKPTTLIDMRDFIV